MADTKPSIDWSKDGGKLTRSALSRVAHLGELYDARSEIFLSRSLLLQTLPPDYVRPQDINHTHIEYCYSDQFSEKLGLLKVEAELQLPLLFGVFSLSSSASYISEQKKSKRSVSGSLVYNIRTVCDRIMISYDELRPYVDLNALAKCGSTATHVVVAIDWGANCMLTLQSDQIEDNSKVKAEGLLKGSLERIKKLVSIDGKGAGTYNDDSKESDVSFRLKVHADILPEGQLPTTIEEGVALLSQVPELVRKVNNGKGKPISYTLVPLSTFREAYQIEAMSAAMVKALDESFIMSVVFFLEDLADAKQQLYDIETDLTKNQDYISGDWLGQTKKKLRDLQVAESRLKTDLAEELVKVRSGVDGAMRGVVRKVDTYKSGDLSLSKIEDFVESLRPVVQRLELVRTLQQGKIVYLKKGEGLAVVLNKEPNKEFYILTIAERFDTDQDLFTKTMQYFISLSLTAQDSQRFVVMDLDLSGGGKSIIGDDFKDKMRILRYKSGKMVSNDVYSEYVAEGSMNMARLAGQTMEHVAYKPAKRVILELPCPGWRLACCSADKLVWVCPICRDHIEFGFDKYFYCICGRGLADKFEFRCCHLMHGSDYIPVPSSYPIFKELEKLQPLKELNVLILGQSGVGKSTWINSIVNYLQYDTLAEAKQGGAICVIPASFTMTYNSTERQVIQIGEESSNENLRVGKSATLGPMSYSFILRDRTVRLIDTPGLGDTDGIDQDKENMRQILDHIGHFKHIHGICILMKSNERRIDTLFKFCIKELLIHLHKSAARNILFCFTNSRSAFYQAGDTSVVLAKLLEECGLADTIPLCNRTMYCLDNEAFRLLCTLRYPNITHKEHELSSYEDSWKLSVRETKRLFDEIRTLPPHEVCETKTLCNARNRILNLTKPIAEISKTLQMNLTVIQEKEMKIRNSTENLELLAKRLYINRIVLEPANLDKPRTVCTHPNCVKTFKMEDSDITQVEYVTHCHSPCSLRNVTPEILPNRDLLRCAAMSGSTCKHCKCSWEHHMHITYSQKRVEKQVENENVKSELNIEKSAKQKIEEYVESLKALTKKYQAEEKIIMQTSLKFGVFLKKNAIAPYNDGFKDYLLYLIREEEGKVNRTQADRNLLFGLQDMLARYEEEVRILKSAMDKGHCNKELTPRDIEKLEQELYDLELMGQQIKDNVLVAENSNRKAKDYCEKPLPVKNRRSGFSCNPQSNGEPEQTEAPNKSWYGKVKQGVKNIFGGGQSSSHEPNLHEVD